MDLIARDDLIAAMHAWVLAKHRAIGEILVEQNALGLTERDALEAMLVCRLAKHGDDPARSLAAMSSLGGVANDLRRAVADPDVLESIAHCAPPGRRPLRPGPPTRSTTSLPTSATTRSATTPKGDWASSSSPGTRS